MFDGNDHIENFYRDNLLIATDNSSDMGQEWEVLQKKLHRRNFFKKGTTIVSIVLIATVAALAATTAVLVSRNNQLKKANENIIREKKVLLDSLNMMKDLQYNLHDTVSNIENNIKPEVKNTIIPVVGENKKLNDSNQDDSISNATSKKIIKRKVIRKVLHVKPTPIYTNDSATNKQ
jgi:hypothetical protein